MCVYMYMCALLGLLCILLAPTTPPQNQHPTITTGAPSPAALRRDVECLVRMVREELGVKRVGLHGESVGGLVAAHAAAR